MAYVSPGIAVEAAHTLIGSVEAHYVFDGRILRRNGTYWTSLAICLHRSKYGESMPARGVGVHQFVTADAAGGSSQTEYSALVKRFPIMAYEYT